MIKVRPLLRPILIVTAGVLLGWFVVAVTIDRVFADSAPATALFWNPGSADANVRLADQQLALTAKAPMIHVRALRALRRQPVAPEAARLLAVAAASQGDEAHATRLLAYAESMSRRDLPTQLLLIETSVTRGDVRAALLHYDRAMRTSPTSWPVLFPILARAADQSAIGVPLSRALAHRPAWERPFLESYVPQARSPETLIEIARQLRLDAIPSPDPAMLQAIEKRLVDLGAYRPAAMLYNRAHGLAAASGPLLRNGDFEHPGGWDPFDWNLVDDTELSSDRQPSPAAGGGTALFLNAANGRGGEVAGQLLILPPGRYRISARVGQVGGDPLARPQLILRCAAGGQELLHQALPAAPANGAAWQADLSVPAACPAEHLVLEARSPIDPQAAAPWVDNIAIRPQGRR